MVTFSFYMQNRDLCRDCGSRNAASRLGGLCWHCDFVSGQGCDGDTNDKKDTNEASRQQTPALCSYPTRVSFCCGRVGQAGTRKKHGTPQRKPRGEGLIARQLRERLVAKKKPQTHQRKTEDALTGSKLRKQHLWRRPWRYSSVAHRKHIDGLAAECKRAIPKQNPARGGIVRSTTSDASCAVLGVSEIVAGFFVQGALLEHTSVVGEVEIVADEVLEAGEIETFPCLLADVSLDRDEFCPHNAIQKLICDYASR